MQVSICVYSSIPPFYDLIPFSNILWEYVIIKLLHKFHNMRSFDIGATRNRAQSAKAHLFRQAAGAWPRFIWLQYPERLASCRILRILMTFLTWHLVTAQCNHHVSFILYFVHIASRVYSICRSWENLLLNVICSEVIRSWENYRFNLALGTAFKGRKWKRNTTRVSASSYGIGQKAQPGQTCLPQVSVYSFTLYKLKETSPRSVEFIHIVLSTFCADVMHVCIHAPPIAGRRSVGTVIRYRVHCASEITSQWMLMNQFNIPHNW